MPGAAQLPGMPGAAAQLQGLKNVSFVSAPGDLFATDASFDVISFLDCFHDMAVATAAARHAYSVLKPDGMVILVEPMAAARDSVLEQLAVPPF